MRTRLSALEVMTRLGWSENDLKEAIINGQMVPSIFVTGPVWPMLADTSGARRRTKPAIFVNDWMYPVGIRHVGPFDCAFEFLAKAVDSLKRGDPVYAKAESGYFKEHIRLTEVLEKGAIDLEQVKNLESHPADMATTSQGSVSLKARPFWQTDYDPVEMARKIEGDAANKVSGVNQRGKRAGQYPLSNLSKTIAAEIQRLDILAGRSRQIGAKTIENFLRKSGWH